MMEVCGDIYHSGCCGCIVHTCDREKGHIGRHREVTEDVYVTWMD